MASEVRLSVHLLDLTPQNGFSFDLCNHTSKKSEKKIHVIKHCDCFKDSEARECESFWRMLTIVV